MTMPGMDRLGNRLLPTAFLKRFEKAATISVILGLAAALLLAQSYHGGVRGTVDDRARRGDTQGQGNADE